jgi:hypothetical protein
MAEWRQLFAAAMTANDPQNIDILIDEASNALDKRLIELDSLHDGEGSRREVEEIMRAAKRLVIHRAETHEESNRG